jgi:hypothetical protein
MVSKKEVLVNPSCFFRGNSQKKAQWRGYILALILGLIVVTLSIWFLFFEYFTSEELEWQECRQSIILRSNAPNLKDLGASSKGLFPLKCRTEVVTIDTIEPDEVYKKIADAVASGWYMFGEGEFEFVSGEFFPGVSYCMAFARLHYTGKASDEFYDGLGLTRSEAEAVAARMRAQSDEDAKKGVEKGMASVEMNPVAYQEAIAAGLGDAEAAEAAKWVNLPKVFMDFDKEFIEFYKKERVPGSKGTYDEYLPLFTKETMDEPHFWLMDDLAPIDKDTILVYKMRTIRGSANSFLGEAITGSTTGAALGLVVTIGAVVLTPLTFGTSLISIGAIGGVVVAERFDFNYFGGKATAELLLREAEMQKKIYAVSPDNFDKLECDKFVVIPA